MDIPWGACSTRGPPLELMVHQRASTGLESPTVDFPWSGWSGVANGPRWRGAPPPPVDHPWSEGPPVGAAL